MAVKMERDWDYVCGTGVRGLMRGLKGFQASHPPYEPKVTRSL